MRKIKSKRTSKTHTFKPFRDATIWSGGKTVQRTSCGMAVIDRPDPNRVRPKSFEEALSLAMVDNFSLKYLAFPNLPQNVWFLSGWDHLEIEVVDEDPTCGNCKRTT